MDWFSIVQSLAALIFVLGLIAGISYLLRRYGQNMPNTIGKNMRLNVVESRTIDAKRRLMIVACDDTEYVLLLNTNQDILLNTRPLKKAKKS